MTKLYGRVCRVTVQHPTGKPGDFFGTIQVSQTIIQDLRIQVSIEMSLGKQPNKADVTITNLNKTSRAEFARKPLSVTIEAGYDGEYHHLFTGDLRYGNSTLSPPDWETKLQLGDGDRAFRQARVNQSFGPKTTVSQALKAVSTSMGLQMPTDIAGNGLLTQFQSQFQTGTVLSGPARDEMTRLLAPYGCHWSIQKGRLVILRDADVTPGVAILVNSATGLVGSPDIGVPERSGTKKSNQVTVKGKMALYPGMVPGGQIKIESREVNGFYRLSKVKHDLNTHGDDWFSSFEARAI